MFIAKWILEEIQVGKQDQIGNLVKQDMMILYYAKWILIVLKLKEKAFVLDICGLMMANMNLLRVAGVAKFV